MNEEEFANYLRDRYENQIDWYDKKAKWNHKAYQIFQWTAIILASLTPVLILVGQDWSKWIAATVAVLVAITTGVLATFKYQENWINYRTTCETLRKEINFLTADIRGYEYQKTTEDKHSLFVERVEALISRENTLWISTHEKEERPNKR